MAKLQKGINDLKTWCLTNGEFGQQLLNEWTGQCEDGKLYKIDEVSFGSQKKFKWRCKEGHEWVTSVNSRTNAKSACQYCLKQHALDKNNLKVWCLNNQDFGKLLMQEWTGECEDGKHYELDGTSFGSNKKFKWICSEGHWWIVTIVSRTSYKTGCPICSQANASSKMSEARLQKGINDLKTWCLNNGDFGTRLMQEWTGECEDGKHYEIDGISFGSRRKKFKWKCSEGHEWSALVVTRTNCKSGCPCCSGRIASAERNLNTWCLSNGKYGQQLQQEWTGECEDGTHYKIEEITEGSIKKFKWKYRKGHEWFSTVQHRTYGRQCPICSANGTSYPEQFIYWSLKQIYPNTENCCRVLKSPQNPHGIEFDIGIPDIPLCIEYSPTYWHNTREEQDGFKKEICEKANVRLIQIVDDSYDELEHSISDTYICFKMDQSKQDEMLVHIVDHILKSLGHSISEIDIELVKKNAWEYSRGKVEYEKSLEYLCPELVKEWHQTLNNGLKPADVTCGSSRKVYWQCQKCNYGSSGEWRATVHRRASQKSGCPKCGYNWSDGKIHTTSSTIITKGVNDIQSQFPELAKEWHPTLNKDLKPDKIKCGSGTKVYWQCQKCNYGSTGEWYIAIAPRTSNKSGCPQCGHNWYKAQQGLPQKYKGKYSYLNDQENP